MLHTFCSIYRHFIDENVYSIEEVWYRRAVEYNMVNDESYVYSVPFDNGKLSIHFKNYNIQ